MGAQPPVTVASVAGWDRRYVPVAVLYAGCWLRCSDADFRDFLLVLRHTGCRPQEARHCDFKAAKIKFAKGDVPGKPWEREIPLNDTAYGNHIDKREEHLRECIEKGTKKYRSA